MDTYNFALHPNNHQPSGHMNYLRMDNAYLDLNLKYDPPKNIEPFFLNLVKWMRSLPPFMRKNLLRKIIKLSNLTEEQQKILIILEWTMNLEHDGSAGSLFNQVCEINNKKFHNIQIWATSYNFLNISNGVGGLHYST